jgi:hypothetical protein
MTDARKVAFRQIAEASLAADALVPVNTNYATTAFVTHTFTVACRSWYLLGSGRGGRSQGLEFVGSNLLQKPVYKKPGRPRDKVEPTGHRNEHRCGPTDRQ